MAIGRYDGHHGIYVYEVTRERKRLNQDFDVMRLVISSASNKCPQWGAQRKFHINPKSRPPYPLTPSVRQLATA